ncbi:hypothetical protein ACR9YC_04110 [Parasphingorhabdus sp. DH2-15]|uniref:hypothetical protein n=1 Tax=Parasphingorhabdus sp. DH2-15 TaxID=3444112 RepID=UPI003F6893AB
MQISPPLSEYRAQPHRRAQAIQAGKKAFAAWQNHPVWAGYRALLEHAVTLSAVDAIRHLRPILDDNLIAPAFLEHFLSAMTHDELVQLQCPATLSVQSTVIILLRHGRINIALVALRKKAADASGNAMHDRICLSNGHSALRLINGAQADYRLFARDHEEQEAMVLTYKGRVASDASLIIDNSQQGLLIDVLEQPALFLRITVEDDGSSSTNGDDCYRYFDAQTGRLLGKSAGNMQSTRRLMLLSALRSLGAAHHAPEMLVVTEEPVAALRWQAMRECLATDMKAAMPRLADMAKGDPDDEIRALAHQILQHIGQKAA